VPTFSGADGAEVAGQIAAYLAPPQATMRNVIAEMAERIRPGATPAQRTAVIADWARSTGRDDASRKSIMRSLQRYEASEGKQQRTATGARGEKLQAWARELGVGVDPRQLRRPGRIRRVAVSLTATFTISNDSRHRTVEMDSREGEIRRPDMAGALRDPVGAFVTAFDRIARGVSIDDLEDVSVTVEREGE